MASAIIGVLQDDTGGGQVNNMKEAENVLKGGNPWVFS